MAIGERIKERREELKISQIDLATKVSISKQNLYKYENNIITNIPSNKIEEIAKVLKTSPEFLMGWKEKPTNYENMELIADIAGDPEILGALKKIVGMSREQRLRVYGFIDGVYSEKKTGD